MPTKIVVTANEIREDFALKLQRRLTGMGGRCTCGATTVDHEPPCPIYFWGRAAWMVGLVLDEERD